MAERKECKKYINCGFRKELAGCPLSCIHYKHKDEVRVVRCKGCKHWLHMEDGFGDCTNGRFHLDGHADPTMRAEDFCCLGERRENNA